MKKLKKFDTAEIGKYEDLIYFGLAVFIVLGLFCAAVWGVPRGSGSYTQCIGSPCDTLYLPVSKEEPGYITDNTTNSINLNSIRISSAVNRLEILANNTNYIQLRNTLQSGATFYVSSGTVYSLNIGTPAISSVGFGFTVSTRSLIGVIRSTATGSAGDPSLQIGNDTNTGLFSSATDAIGFSAGGTERLTIGSNVGISSSSPRVALGVTGGIHTTSSMTAVSALIQGNLTTEGQFASSGSMTLGDASGDLLTIQSSSITLINQTTIYANVSPLSLNSVITITSSHVAVGTVVGPAIAPSTFTVWGISVGPSCVSNFTRVGLSCCYDTDGAYETLVTSTPVAIHQTYTTLNSTTLNPTSAKLVMTTTRVFVDSDGDANEGTTRFRTRQTGSGASGSFVEALTAASVNDYMENAYSNETILDSNRDFDYSCGITADAEAAHICTIYLRGYCE